MTKPTYFALSCILVVFAMPLGAQTSTGFSPADQYKAVKDTMQQFYLHGLVQSNIRKPDYSPNARYDRPGEYDLFYCGEAGSYLGWLEDDRKGLGPVADLTDLALRMVVWENDFRKLGVPEQVWRPILEKFETAALERPSLVSIDESVDTIPKLAAALNAQNARAGRTRPKFVSEGGCGAGEIEAHFALSPANGQLFLIPVFLYKVCQAQHLKPMDLTSCDRWREVFAGRVAAVSGDYMYMARWADGVIRCGLLSINDFMKKQDSAIEIAKLRSPECSPAW